jgi:sugar-phosphatase
MGAAGLALPEVLVTAECVSASKPDPEGFLKGAAELGFDPERCVVFEDSQAGIAAGLAAGMRVVGVGPRAGEGPHRPTALVRTLEQVAVAALPGGGVELTIR